MCQFGQLCYCLSMWETCDSDMSLLSFFFFALKYLSDRVNAD